MAKFILGAALALSLTACGGGGSSSSSASTAPAEPDSLIAIGNSITFYTPNPSLGWTGSWGLASSTQAKDYVHLVGSARGLGATVFNVAPLERDASRVDLIQASTSTIDSRTDVIVEIGENAPSGGSADFTTSYGQLLDAVVAQHPHALFCLSDYWADPPKDAMKQEACKAHGGTFVDVGGIYYAHMDAIPTGENPAISDHPHDLSMAAMARTILTAMKTPA